MIFIFFSKPERSLGWKIMFRSSQRVLNIPSSAHQAHVHVIRYNLNRFRSGPWNICLGSQGLVSLSKAGEDAAVSIHDSLSSSSLRTSANILQLLIQLHGIGVPDQINSIKIKLKQVKIK